MGPPLERLRDTLDDSQWARRCRAARLLGELGDLRAVPPLLRALCDQSAAVRRASVDALGRLRDMRALGALVASLGDDNDEVRRHAAAALKQYGDAALPTLLDAYKSGSLVLRRSAIDLLGDFRAPKVSELLIAALDDPDRSLHAAALGLLVRRKDMRAVERLIAGLAEAGQRREVCAWALGHLGDHSAFEPLCALLHDDDPTMQMAVVKALRTIDNARAVDLLHAALDDAEGPRLVRLEQTLAALDLMGAIGVICRKVKDGGVDSARLGNALAAVHAEAQRAVQRHIRSRKPPVDRPETAPRDPLDPLRRSAAAMRQLEAKLRDLTRGS